MTETTGNYAQVNGLNMYYEMHGSGSPLVLLHGGLSNIQTDFGRLIPSLAQSHRIIGVEQQGYGHTADIDRPFSIAQMADDTVALLDQLGIANADFFGYSLGGGIGFHIAQRHPDLVRKLVYAGGACYARDGFYPELIANSEPPPPEVFAETPWYKAYMQIAPHPEDWATMVAKNAEIDKTFTGWTADEVRAIQAPTLLIIGDSDITRPEHVAEMFRLLGGGVPGDIYGLPRAQLAVLPGTTHVTLMDRTDWLYSMVEAFLSAPVPEVKPNV